MQLPFEGFQIPTLAYLLALGSGAVIVVAVLYVLRPPVTQRTVVSFIPWVVSGAILHVFYQLGETFGRQIYPAWAEPLFAAPAVYVTTFVGMGAVWVVASVVGGTDGTSRSLTAMGTGVAVPLVGLVVWQGLDPALSVRPFVPLVTLIVTGVITFAVYIGIGIWRTYVIAGARLVGAVVLYAHLLDGISTAVAVDVYGQTERSVLPARILEFAGDLPTAEAIGTGWLFVLVKLVVVVLVIVSLSEYVREDPVRGNLLFGAIAAVGLGPAVNNIVLFFLGF